MDIQLPGEYLFYDYSTIWLPRRNKNNKMKYQRYLFLDIEFNKRARRNYWPKFSFNNLYIFYYIRCWELGNFNQKILWEFI